jgi:hypothetical protein
VAVPGFGFRPDPPPLPWDPPSPDPRIPPAPPPEAFEPPPPPPAAAPFGAPFALPEESGDEAPFGGGAEPRTGFGWAWEPPEDEPKP